jgi:uracil permease
VAITGVYSVWVIRGAALLQSLFRLSGKSLPYLAFNSSNGRNNHVVVWYGTRFQNVCGTKSRFQQSRNMVLGAITFIIGVSGARITLGTVQLKGMAFAAIVGVLLSLIFWLLDKIGVMNEEA